MLLLYCGDTYVKPKSSRLQQYWGDTCQTEVIKITIILCGDSFVKPKLSKLAQYFGDADFKPDYYNIMVIHM